MINQLGRQILAGATDGWFLAAQLATTPFDWWMSNRIRLKVQMPNNLFVPRGTLIVSNHVSFLDPFLITYHLARRNWYHTVPTRFPTTPSYANRLIIGTFIQLLGAYSIGETTVGRAKKLLYTRDLLERGHTVLLFPEGRIVEKGEVVAGFKQGARMLVTQDYSTLFVRLSGFDTKSFFAPNTVVDARMDFSDIVRGDAETKLMQLRHFFGDEAI